MDGEPSRPFVIIANWRYPVSIKQRQSVRKAGTLRRGSVAVNITRGVCGVWLFAWLRRCTNILYIERQQAAVEWKTRHIRLRRFPRRQAGTLRIFGRRRQHRLCFIIGLKLLHYDGAVWPLCLLMIHFPVMCSPRTFKVSPAIVLANGVAFASCCAYWRTPRPLRQRSPDRKLLHIAQPDIVPPHAVDDVRYSG